MMEQKHKSFFWLIVALLVFTIGAAVFADGNDMVYEPTEETEEIENTEKSDKTDKTEAANGTNTEGVLSSAAADRDFFADFRIGRGRRRDEREEMYLRIMEDSTREEAAKAEAESGLSQLYAAAAMEDQVEEILIGRHYRDAIFVLGENISLLMVKEPNLDDGEKAALAAFVCSYTGVEENRLSIFSVE